MVGLHVMTPCYSRYGRPRLKTLRDNPRLHSVRPAPIAPASLHNLAPPNKSMPDIRHSDTLLKSEEKSPLRSRSETAYLNGTRTPDTFLRLIAAACCQGKPHMEDGNRRMKGCSDRTNHQIFNRKLRRVARPQHFLWGRLNIPPGGICDR